MGKSDPESFDRLIQVKSNASELLSKKIGTLTKDVILECDWQQPLEEHYQLSRKMLEIIAEFEFPLFIVERSPLVNRDLDLLQEIQSLSNACVAISVSSLNPQLKRAFEPGSPGIDR